MQNSSFRNLLNILTLSSCYHCGSLPRECLCTRAGSVIPAIRHVPAQGLSRPRRDIGAPSGPPVPKAAESISGRVCGRSPALGMAGMALASLFATNYWVFAVAIRRCVAGPITQCLCFQIIGIAVPCGCDGTDCRPRH